MVSGISLANKCQLLFGIAVLLILTAALTAPWLLWQSGVRESQYDVARQIADGWLAGRLELIFEETVPGPPALVDDGDATLRSRLIDTPGLAAIPEANRFARSALARFEADPGREEHVAVEDVDGEAVYRYARVLRGRDAAALAAIARRDPLMEEHTFQVAGAPPNEILGMLIVERPSRFAKGQLLQGASTS